MGPHPDTGLRYDESSTNSPDGTVFDTYIHTADSAPAPSPWLVVERDGTLVMQSGTFTFDTIDNHGSGTIHLAGGTLRGTSRITNAATLKLDGGLFETAAFSNAKAGDLQLLSGDDTLSFSTNEGRFTASGGTVTFGNLTNSGVMEISGGTVTTTGDFNQSSSGVLLLKSGVFEIAGLAQQQGAILFQGGHLRLSAGDLSTGTASPWGRAFAIGQSSVLEVAAGETHIGEGDSLALTGSAAWITQGGTNEGTIDLIASEFTSASGLFTNRAGAGMTAVDSRLDFQGDGLLNLGQLTLVRATVDGDVQSPGGSTVVVGGHAPLTGCFRGRRISRGSGPRRSTAGIRPATARRL